MIGITVALGRLGSAAPRVERSAVWIDTVKRGPMLRRVTGPGVLVPEQIRWITAETAGRVERIEARPGVAVTPDTLLLELSNPDVVLQALEAERQLAGAEAELLELKGTLEAQLLSGEAQLATLKAEDANARRRAQADARLKAGEFVMEAALQESVDRAEEMAARLALEERRLALLKENMRARLGGQRAQVERLKAVVAFRRKQVESMRVRAGDAGALQELPLELGQWVTPGTVLAKVSRSDRLKAELRIPETQAKDVQVGQAVDVDIRSGHIPGRVSRIAPAASQGTVLVEVALEGELPKGARPDFSVQGTVEVERLGEVLSIGRPAGVQPFGQVELFRVSANDRLAERVKVRLGRSSVDAVEIVEGLNAGERVILSDMSMWEKAERLRIE